MKLAPKILSPIIALAVVLVSIVGLALWIQNEMASLDEQVASIREQVFQAAEVRSLGRAIQRDVLKSATEGWETNRAGLDRSVESRSDALLARAAKLSKTFGRGETEMGQFLPLQERFLAEIAVVRGLVSSGNAVQARSEFVRRVEPAEKAASQLLDGFIERGERSVAAASEKSDRFHAVAPVLLFSISGLSLVIALGGAAAFVMRGIIRPLRDIEGAVGKMAAGDYDLVLRGADRKDELGSITRAVGGFRDALASGAQLRAEQARLQQSTDEERARNEADRVAAAQEQAFVVSSIGRGLEHLAEGDLTFRLTDAFSGEYKKLQDDFNAALGSLQETMRTIAGATEGIRSGTGEVSQAADDLSKRTEQQAASLEQTAAALDEITATVRKTADGANHAREVVATAKTDAERSGDVVRGAVQAMAEIDRSSKEISNIIGVIDEIAFQTNLLALNAGVEAARAGEAGKGFAVVASEVRALAQRSAEAAKEIKALIQASSTQVGSGVNLVGQAGKALARIAQQVADINEVVLEIAASAKEQATGLAEVNTAVNQMDQVTQQNAAMVEQSTAASHSLSQEAEELRRLIARFKVGGESQRTNEGPKRQVPAQRKAGALKVVGGRGVAAARRPEPEEGWEEF